MTVLCLPPRFARPAPRRRLAAAVLAALAAPWPVVAQEADRPAVEVDLSVLDALPPAEDAAALPPVTLTPPPSAATPAAAGAAASGDTTPDPSPAAEVAAAGTAAAPSEPPDAPAVQLVFEGASTELTAEATAALAGIAQLLTADEAARVEIRAFAGGTPESAGQARSLSLDRALAIKEFLVGRGVRGSRIDIFALGNTAPGGPQDRADVSLLN